MSLSGIQRLHGYGSSSMTGYSLEPVISYSWYGKQEPKKYTKDNRLPAARKQVTLHHPEARMGRVKYVSLTGVITSSISVMARASRDHGAPANYSRAPETMISREPGLSHVHFWSGSLPALSGTGNSYTMPSHLRFASP